MQRNPGLSGRKWGVAHPRPIGGSQEGRVRPQARTHRPQDLRRGHQAWTPRAPGLTEDRAKREGRPWGESWKRRRKLTGGGETSRTLGVEKHAEEKLRGQRLFTFYRI